MNSKLIAKIIAFLAALTMLSAGFTYFLLPKIIDDKMNDTLIKKSVLSSENFEMWGKIPGSLGLNFTTSYYLYNLTNAEEVSIHNIT